MERRNANIIFSKNGNGFVSNKITLPVPWVKELGFTDNDRKAIIEFDNDKIIIKKEKCKMKKIDFKNFNYQERLNEEIWCVELVSNDKEEIGYDLYECENEEEAIKECESRNYHNTDKNYKYIVVQYTVKEDHLEV